MDAQPVRVRWNHYPEIPILTDGTEELNEMFPSSGCLVIDALHDVLPRK